MRFADCFFRYLDYIRISKSLGTYRFTAAHGVLILREFGIHCISSIRSLNDSSIKKVYRSWEKSLSRSTIEKRLGIIKRVLKYSNLVIKGVTDFPVVKFKQKGFEVVPRCDLVKLMAYFNEMNLTPNDLTRYLVFMILFYTGVRSGELCAIKIANIDLYSCSVMLDHTKNGRPRVVFFDRAILDRLQLYIAVDPHRKFLFKDFRYNHEFCPDMVMAILRYATKKLKIGPIHPHMLRHTFATMLVENGCPLVPLQYVLGHSDPKTTEIYMHMSTGYLKKNYDMYSPKL